MLFPEGTSSDGDRLLRFQSVPFAAPLRIGAPVIPITLTYTTVNRQTFSKLNRDLIYCYGNMDLISHLWALLALRRIEAAVRIHPTIETNRFKDDSQNRKRLSRICHAVIGALREKKPLALAPALPKRWKETSCPSCYQQQSSRDEKPGWDLALS